VPVNGSRRFSQAISEGDGISLIARIDSVEAAGRAAADGAEALLVSPSGKDKLGEIRAAVSLPILFSWDGEKGEVLTGADACVIGVAELQGGIGSGDELERTQVALGDRFELVFRIDDEEQLEETLERYDPEIFVLAAPESEGEEALERVLDLLPDVPAGKLAIAELPASTRDDVGSLERAGVDGVIVEPAAVAQLASAPQPEV
jgi:hypothetical protein